MPRQVLNLFYLQLKLYLKASPANMRFDIAAMLIAALSFASSVAAQSCCPTAACNGATCDVSSMLKGVCFNGKCIVKG